VKILIVGGKLCSNYPLIEAVEAILLQLSNRDAVGFDEKYVKAVFASLLYSTQIYTIHSGYQ